MSFSRRPLFLAGLVLAAACSDAGTLVDTREARPGPDAASESLVQAFTCRVDAIAGTHTCALESPRTGAALGAISIRQAIYVSLATSNTVSTTDSLSVDVALINHMLQPLGTTDGVNAHPFGIRAWVEPPFNVDTIVPGQPTSITVANADGTMTWNSTYPNRPYFLYQGLLATGDTTAAKTWKFAKQNVNTFSYKVFVATEVPFPKGWLAITPVNPVVSLGDVDTLAAHVRGPYGNLHNEAAGLTWISTNPSVVSVLELAPKDTLAQITAVAAGTAWIKARSSNAADSLARRDSVLVTVN